MSKILIDAGHTDHVDPGAVANGTTEHTEAKQIATDVVAKLGALPEFSGYEIVLMPTEKTLIQKIQYANSVLTASDYLVSIHLNSASPQATGTETYYLGGDQNSQNRAQLFQTAAVGVLGLADRGIARDTSTRFGRLGIIRDVHAKTLLFEVGFISNPTDLARVRLVAADAVVAGLRAMLGLTATATPTPNTGSNTAGIRALEAQLDAVLLQGKQLTKWEADLLQKRKKWDMELDRLRGVLLGEIEKNKMTLDPVFQDIETKDMRVLALSNNDIILFLDQMLQKRIGWESNVDALRKALKNYLPS